MTLKPFYKRKIFIVLGIILLALIIFRLMLPQLVKNYVNKSLSSIPGYYGHVEDIDISLWRGAYAIDKLYLNKKDGTTQVPFINLAHTDISVQWKSLFKGHIVSEIGLTNPEVIYVFEDHGTAEESDINDWTEVLTDLVPISINQLEITNGKLAFVQVIPDPTIDVQVHSLNATASNLQNVIDKDVKLPSKLKLTGRSIGNGNLNIEGKLNLLKLIPDMDISVALEDAEITAFNDLLKEHAKLDFESGSLSVFSEIAIADGYLKSYLKPLLKESKLIGPEDGFFEKLWEGFVGFFKFILKNQDTEKVATKIPIEGNLNNSSTDIWGTVCNLFRNAWIEAFKNKTDNTIDFQDAETLNAQE